MTEYRCLVIDAEGRRAWRRVEAGDERRLRAMLATDGALLVEVRGGAMGLIERLNQPIDWHWGIGIGEQALIIGQLATLVGSGLPVDRSLDLLRDQASKARQRAAVAAMLARVRAGDGLARAMENSRLFPDYAVGVVRAAEQSGRMGEALTALAARLAGAAETRRRLLTALTYPAAVMAATLVALALVLTVVVPQFAPIFAGREAQLPVLTRGVLAVADLVNRQGLLVLGAAAALVAGLWLALRATAGGAFGEALRRYLPGAALADQFLAAQFTGLMALLAGNGVKIVPALALARQATASHRWRAHLQAVERRVREGSTLSAALALAPFMPRTAIRLIEVGERSGKLAETCAKASAIIGAGAQARLERIVALANPVAIVALGGVVALLVGGVMLGIFSLGDFVG